MSTTRGCELVHRFRADDGVSQLLSLCFSWNASQSLDCDRPVRGHSGRQAARAIAGIREQHLQRCKRASASLGHSAGRDPLKIKALGIGKWICGCDEENCV